MAFLLTSLVSLSPYGPLLASLPVSLSASVSLSVSLSLSLSLCLSLSLSLSLSVSLSLSLSLCLSRMFLSVASLPLGLSPFCFDAWRWEEPVLSGSRATARGSIWERSFESELYLCLPLCVSLVYG